MKWIYELYFFTCPVYIGIIKIINAPTWIISMASTILSIKEINLKYIILNDFKICTNIVDLCDCRVGPSFIRFSVDGHVCVPSHCHHVTSAIRHPHTHRLHHTTPYLLCGPRTHAFPTRLSQCKLSVGLEPMLFLLGSQCKLSAGLDPMLFLLGSLNVSYMWV